MAVVVYSLCAIVSIVCATVLLRAYRAGKSSLLLWCSVCFFALALNNVLLFIDLVITGPTIDLSMTRAFVVLAGFGAMLYGLIWETV